MVAGWLCWLGCAGWPVRLFVGFLFVDDVGRGDCVLAVPVSFFGLRGSRERETVKGFAATLVTD